MPPLDRPLLLKSLRRVPAGQFNPTGFTDFIDELDSEILTVVDAIETIDVVAAEDLSAFVTVTATGNRADSANGAHYGKVVGVTTVDVLEGFVAALVVDQEITNGSWSWSPGAQLFLNGTTISETPTSTGFSQQIGVARSSTTMIVQIQPPILL